MTPAARAQAAIEILDTLGSDPFRFDDFFRRWARQHRYAGSKDRAAIKDLVYRVFRHRGEIIWRIPHAGGRMLVAGLLRWADGESLEALEALFNGQTYAPASLSPDEQAQLRHGPQEEMPLWARHNVPSWLEPELRRQFGADLENELMAMAGRAPLHVRANELKTTRDRLHTEFERLGLSCSPLVGSPNGLELPADAKLLDLDLYKSGMFEVQDLGSQIAGRACRVQPGDCVVDLAAGAGGKTLQLAAAMENRGRLVAGDIDDGRLQRLVERAGRAGADRIETQHLSKNHHAELIASLGEKADVVLVDAPCSGTGTWRRQPEARWWLTPERLTAYVKVQTELVALGEKLLKPGGRLVYVTCSVLPMENQDVVTTIETGHPTLMSVSSARLATELGISQGADIRSPGLQLTPARHKTDGFYINVFAKNRRGNT